MLADNRGAVNNGGTLPDAIELYNAGAAAVNLGDMSLSDSATNARKYVFPAGTTLASGAYLVLYADAAGPGPGIHLGFSLDVDGEGVYLYDKLAAGGGLLDSVVFGKQVANLSIGRVGQERAWALTTPTFGSANIAARTGDRSLLEINEWLADSKVKLASDFIELYNTDTLPVDLAGLYLTDNIVNDRDKSAIPPLSYIAAGGFAAFTADGSSSAASHLLFSLDADTEEIGLYESDLRAIDKLVYFPQTTDASQGRSPDGAVPFAYYTLPTPGASNGLATNATALALLANLRITELMYNPLGSSAAEYIELRNISGSTTLDLTGVRLSGAIEYTFGATNLAPGAYLVVTSDVPGLASRYGTIPGVVGPFAGSLSNGGEEIVLQLADPLAAAVLRFTYNDTWYPLTDGQGYSLAINSQSAAPETWGSATSWHVSTAIGGSPGGTEVGTVAAITAHAFDDGNANGLQDANEIGVASLVTNLYSAGGNGQIGGGDDVLVRSGSSDAQGDVSFFKLPAGVYYLQFVAAPGQTFTLRDQGGNDTLDSDVDPLTGLSAIFPLAASQYDTTRDVGLRLGPAVVGRFVFYNNSVFDGDNPAATAADDIVIATDKQALLPGAAASSANYTNYSRGINGVMIDIARLSGAPTAGDFIFRVGNTANPATWSLAPAPLGITLRPGAGVGSSTRVSIVWADGAIQKQWLQVTVKAAPAAAGLAVPDVFYFGNAVGDTYDSPTNAIVNATDEINARNNPRSFKTPAELTTVHDFNHDGFVNAADQILARSNATGVNSLLFFTPPAGFSEALTSEPPDLSALAVGAALLSQSDDAADLLMPSGLPAIEQEAAAIASSSAPPSQMLPSYRRADRTIQRLLEPLDIELDSDLVELLATKRR